MASNTWSMSELNCIGTSIGCELFSWFIVTRLPGHWCASSRTTTDRIDRSHRASLAKLSWKPWIASHWRLDVSINNRCVSKESRSRLAITCRLLVMIWAKYKFMMGHMSTPITILSHLLLTNSWSHQFVCELHYEKEAGSRLIPINVPDLDIKAIDGLRLKGLFTPITLPVTNTHMISICW